MAGIDGFGVFARLECRSLALWDREEGKTADAGSHRFGLNWPMSFLSVEPMVSRGLGLCHLSMHLALYIPRLLPSRIFHYIRSLLPTGEEMVAFWSMVSTKSQMQIGLAPLTLLVSQHVSTNHTTSF